MKKIERTPLKAQSGNLCDSHFLQTLEKHSLINQLDTRSVRSTVKKITVIHTRESTQEKKEPLLVRKKHSTATQNLFDPLAITSCGADLAVGKK